jgi:hypothetical protein
VNNTYQPNINDPRIQRRITRALGFIGSHLSDSKSHPWSTRYIDKYLGIQSNDLSKWLRARLLICTNDRYSKDTGICKEYIKNSTGYNNLMSLLKSITSYPSVLQVGNPVTKWVKDEYKNELSSKVFTYDDKSDRLWHPLQRIRKEHKIQVFSDHGLIHQYDIECCAPTLIHQYSQSIPEIVIEGNYIQGPMDLYLFALREYFTDRQRIRQVIATQADISVKTTKEIINALLMGAHLSNNKDSDIFNLLNGDKAKIEFLKQHPYLCELRQDIKTCWDYIKPLLSRKSITTKLNKQRLLPISSKQKAGVYFKLERQVLNAIRNYLDNTSNKYFLEHDGWVCMDEIDRVSLIKWVKDSTGYHINLDYSSLLKSITSYPSVLQVGEMILT